MALEITLSNNINNASLQIGDTAYFVSNVDDTTTTITYSPNNIEEIGKITAIGGLDIKILGGIEAGIKEFIYPEENTKTFGEFIEKYKDNECIEGIKFHKVEDISEVLKLVFV